MATAREGKALRPAGQARGQEQDRAPTPVPQPIGALIITPVGRAGIGSGCQGPFLAWSWASMKAFRNAMGDEIPATGACGSPAPAMTRVPKLNMRPRIS